MLIDRQIKDLVTSIEECPPHSTDELKLKITQLIRLLYAACMRTENQARYALIHNSTTAISPYPMAADGYAQGFDPLEDEASFLDAWQRYGVVVGKRVVSAELCARAQERIATLLHTLSAGDCELDKINSWQKMPRDSAGIPLLTRGFFEVYHDAMLAELRQAVRIYIHHVVIWGRVDLWTSFDRLGVKLPGHEESYGLPLHVDQNPTVHPDFKTIQGVLALTDCPARRGTFMAVPGSRQYFKDYETFVTSQGEYVELDVKSSLGRTLQQNAHPIPLRAGDLVTWDSRTTHANTQNLSNDIRMVAYIAAGPANPTAEALAARHDAFITGLGSNKRDALMHASKKPRYTAPEALARVRHTEQLNFLGRLLYGQEDYAAITSTP